MQKLIKQKIKITIEIRHRIENCRTKENPVIIALTTHIFMYYIILYTTTKNASKINHLQITC